MSIRKTGWSRGQISKTSMKWYWTYKKFEEKRKELLEICNAHRSKDGNYDCIVPWSGGKDSSYIAHKLKFEFKMNPLLVTFSPLIENECGIHNRNELSKMG